MQTNDKVRVRVVKSPKDSLSALGLPDVELDHSSHIDDDLGVHYFSRTSLVWREGEEDETVIDGIEGPPDVLADILRRLGVEVVED